MMNVKDKLKLDAEELKRELMNQVDEYRQQFDQLLSTPDVTDEEKLRGLDFIWAQSASILTFLATKAGIDIRTDGGGMWSDSLSGYYMAKIGDVKARIKSSVKD